MTTTAITVETLSRITDLEAKAEQNDALLGRIMVLEEKFERLEEKAKRMEEEWADTKTLLDSERMKMRTEMEEMK